MPTLVISKEKQHVFILRLVVHSTQRAYLFKNQRKRNFLFVRLLFKNQWKRTHIFLEQWDGIQKKMQQCALKACP
jgi:hypothetical protein